MAGERTITQWDPVTQRTIQVTLPAEPADGEPFTTKWDVVTQKAYRVPLGTTTTAPSGNRVPMATKADLATTQASVDAVKQDLSNFITANAAGGVLGGAFPNPGFAKDMAYQSELDAHAQATQSVHGIGDTAALVVTTDPRLSDARTPLGHQHPIDDVTNLQSALDAKANTAALSTAVTTLQQADANLTTTLSGKVGTDDPRLSNARMPMAHQHDASDLTGTLALARLPVAVSGASSATQLVRADDIRLSDSRTPLTHQHPISDVTGLQTALAGKVDSNDARLTDARTPTAHQQAWSTITGTPTTLVGYGISDAATATALSAHVTATNNPHSVTAAQIGALTQATADPLYKREVVVPFWYDTPTAAITFTMVAALTEHFPRTRTKFDLTGYTQSRFEVYVVGAGTATAELRLQYSLDQTTWTYLDGAAGPGAGVATVNALAVGAWVTIVPAARADVFLRVVGINGGGSTSVANVRAHFR